MRATDTLFPALEARPGRVAMELPAGSVTWTELARACAGHVAALRDRGVAAGDRVAVTAQPTLAMVATLLGNLVHGAVTVPLSARLSSREREHILADARPVWIADEADPTFARPGEVAGDLAIEVGDQAALVIYTSGTTGQPKGAVLSVRNIAHCLDGLIEAWGWSEDDTVVHALPLFHVHGLVLGLMGSLRVGGRMHALARFDVDAVTAALAARGTLLFAVPTMYHRLAAAVSQSTDVGAALRSARLLISGSAPLAGRDARELHEGAGVTVRERYGLTETLINCAARHDEPVVRGTVGRPLAGTEVRIVDEGRQPVPRGEMGEVAVRGPNVFLGYLNRPDATAAVIDESGWFYTGDVGHLGDSGRLVVHGRKSTDLIKTGGFKVGAGEIEACLLERDDVAEVAVVGVPDDDLGERIEAFVVPSGEEPSADRLLAWATEQLSPYKRPRAVHFVGELPRNALGKIQKPALIARLTRGAQGHRE